MHVIFFHIASFKVSVDTQFHIFPLAKVFISTKSSQVLDL